MYWWHEKSEEARAQGLDAYVSSIIDRQADYQYHYNLRHARLYSNRVYQNLRGVSQGIKKESRLGNGLAIKDNVVKSVIDSVVAKVAKTKVRPRFLTDGGDYSQQMLSEQLNRFVSGLFYASNAHKETTLAFRDACIFGTGAVKIYKEQVQWKASHGKDSFVVKCERISPDSLVVDPADSYNGKPRTLSQVEYRSKDSLKAMFPDKAYEIEQAKNETEYYGQGSYVETVRVVESYALPRGEEKGWHIIEVNGTALFEEEWSKDYFPYAIIRYSEPLYGYFGTGIAEELVGTQIEINRLLQSIQDAMRLVGNPKVFMQKGSVNPNHYDNKTGGIILYEQGYQPPTVVAPNAAPQGALQQIQFHKSNAFQTVGISQLSAASQKPAGLNSGKAITEFRDAETERFSQTVHAYERLHLDLAEIMLDFVRDIGDEYKVTSFDRVNGVEVVNWKDIKLDSNGYVMQIFPVSQLPKDPTGRLQAIQQYISAGVLNAEDALELLELPDLDAKIRLQLASQRVVRKNLDKILKGEEAILPEPSDDLNYALRIATQYYALAREKDYDEEVQSTVRIYIEDIKALVQQMQQQQIQTASPVAQLQQQQLEGQQVQSPIAPQ